jgi:hypothetical protein
VTEVGVVGSNDGDGGKHGTRLKLEVFVGWNDGGRYTWDNMTVIGNDV